MERMIMQLELHKIKKNTLPEILTVPVFLIDQEFGL